jgi:hypothetical protein
MPATVTFESQVQDGTGTIAQARISNNTRAKGAQGFLMTTLEQPLVNGNPGLWATGSTRVFVQNTPVVHQAAFGTVPRPDVPIPSSPLLVTTPDARIQST